MAVVRAILSKAFLPFYVTAQFAWGGLLCTALFACRVVVRPFSRVLYMNMGYAPVVNAICAGFVFALQTVGQVRVRVCSDMPLEEIRRSHSVMAMYNHVNGLDWLVMQHFMMSLGKLGEMRGLGKESLRYIPVIGWITWLGDFIFLKRSMEKDAQRLEYGMEQLRACKRGDAHGNSDFWLTFFPEGTRLTPEKLKESQEWQRKNGIEPMKNIQYPRVKGFQAMWKGLGTHVDSVYTVTLVYPKDVKMSFFRLFRGGPPQEIEFYLHKLDVAALKACGDDDAKLKAFLVAAWREQDRILDDHNARGAFDAPVIQELSAPIGYVPPMFTTIALGTLAAVFGGMYTIPALSGFFTVTVTAHVALAVASVLLF